MVRCWLMVTPSTRIEYTRSAPAIVDVVGGKAFLLRRMYFDNATWKIYCFSSCYKLTCNNFPMRYLLLFSTPQFRKQLKTFRFYLALCGSTLHCVIRSDEHK